MEGGGEREREGEREEVENGKLENDSKSWREEFEGSTHGQES